jgi:hypothetical protein
MFKGKLALMDGLYYYSLNIWVTKEYGVSQTWTKLFVVSFDPFMTLFGYSQKGLLIVRNFLSANGELKKKI